MPNHEEDARTFRLEDLLGPLSEVERKHAPEVLHVKGRVELLRSGVRVSVVGTRRPTAAGIQRAQRIAGALARHGITVVSGLALGIDTVAHRTAMAQGGGTVAVLGTPIDVSATRQNSALQDEIGRSHLLLSQFAAGTAVERRNFPMRNRTMALVSMASVIVEAGEGSGSLSQGWEALRLGRFLFIPKSVADQDGLSWSRQMRDYGALVVRTPEEVLENLPSGLAAGHSELAF
ncbi:MAG: DNA-processing protein DprA [Planctomycetota bacterium]|nr:MAG: DNA-processing protein DprA [Planctomycetota bacterium]